MLRCDAKFKTFNTIHFLIYFYLELDTELGDLQVEIANRETSISIRLIEEILKQSHSFVTLVNKVLMLDVYVNYFA